MWRWSEISEKETQTKKTQEMFNKELEDQKNKPANRNNVISDTKHWRNQEQTNWGRRKNKSKDRMVEITAKEQNKEEKSEKEIQSKRTLQQH